MERTGYGSEAEVWSLLGRVSTELVRGRAGQRYQVHGEVASDAGKVQN